MNETTDAGGRLPRQIGYIIGNEGCERFGFYGMRNILVPFLILSLAALGLNILVGYCGQVSLGTGAFMAVGAYSAYNLALRVPDLNLLVVFVLVERRSRQPPSGRTAGRR